MHMDLFQGDSGAPLMFKLDTGKWALLGLTSFYIWTQHPRVGPTLHTRAAAYREWIYPL